MGHPNQIFEWFRSGPSGSFLIRCLFPQATHDVAPLPAEIALQSDTSTSDGINTFHVGQRREAPPPTLMSQVRCMYAVDCLKVLVGQSVPQGDANF